ncbi:MAG TPA: hypothetical protein VN659_12760 [Pyrinomonadaceae bacterium]|jgi:hypothetical protein|nr:hypothetical protein [Pyrinomonadaceae bacterium]
MYRNKIDLGFPMALVEVFARVLSVMSITLLLLLFQAEAFHPSEIAPREWFGLVFFPIGVIVGLAIAWWKEGLGISITIGSLLAFYFVYGYLLRYHIGGWAFVMFASPAFLFFFHWVLTHTSHEHAVG